MLAFECCEGDIVTVALTDGRVVTGAIVDCVYHRGYWTFWIEHEHKHSRPYRASEDVDPHMPLTRPE